MATDKRILVKGLTKLGWALPMFFTGPVILHSSFKNEGKTWLFYPVVTIGILVCIGGILLMFLGLKTIMKSLFDGDQQ